MASSSSSASKRKHVVLLLESKIAILDRLKAGATQAQLAEEYGIGSSTVQRLTVHVSGRFTYPAIAWSR